MTWLRASIVLLLFTAVISVAEEEVPDDPAGVVRHDADGLEQMWGGPALPEIRSTEQLQIIYAGTAKEPAFVFKHSTQCPISARAAARVQRFVEANPESPPIYWLKVIETRPASNLLASLTGVQHESPQLILLKEGEATWDESHDEITAATISEGLDTLGAAQEPKSVDD